MIDEGLNIPRPDLNDTERLVNVIFPAIVLELGPPPRAVCPICNGTGTDHGHTGSSPCVCRQRGFQPVNHKPPRGLGAAQMRESTQVGSKSPPPAPRLWDNRSTYHEDVYGLLRYRYGFPRPDQLTDSFFDWCQRQEQL